MVFRDKNRVTAPVILSSPDSIAEIADYVTNINTNIKVEYTVYGAQEVRDALNVIYYNKCCYCERTPESTLQVEHYRPKGRITSVNRTGYYWMGNEWTNLLLACDTCNNKKRNKFPLAGNYHIVDHPFDMHGNLLMSEIPANSTHLAQELPLIINPSETDPSLFLTINELGHYESIGVGDFGAKTILYLGLNRDSYVYRRQKIIDEFIDNINNLILMRYDNDLTVRLSSSQYKNLLNVFVFKRIVAMRNDHAEYNMMGLCIIEKFDEMILEEIEPEFRGEIRNNFIEFLEN